MHEYAQMGIPYYVIFDPTAKLSDEPLRVFELRPRSFQRSADDFLPAVGLGVRLWEGFYEGKFAVWLRWCDRAGNVLLVGKERAEYEAQRAEHEAQRASRLAARLRELGVDPDQI